MAAVWRTDWKETREKAGQLGDRLSYPGQEGWMGQSREGIRSRKNQVMFVNPQDLLTEQVLRIESGLTTGFGA